MGRVKKYVKKQAKRLYGYAKKRYVPNGRIDVVRIAKDLNEVRKAINVEKKYKTEYINTQLGIGATAPGIWAPLNGLAQSASPTGRIGDQVKFLWMSARMVWECNSSLTTNAYANMVRILVVHDREPRGDSALSATVLRDYLLEDPSAEGGINSFYSNETKNGVGDRFKILRDFKFPIDNIKQKQKAITVNLNFCKMFPKSQGLRVSYGPGDNNLRDDQIYILAITNDPNATPVTAVTSATRACYVDN